MTLTLLRNDSMANDFLSAHYLVLLLGCSQTIDLSELSLRMSEASVADAMPVNSLATGRTA